MKIIEFIGMPRAGKTEQINRLSNRLGNQKIKHLIITDREIEKEINVPVTKAFEYNILFYNKILDKLLTAIHSEKYDFIILDRGFSEADVWFNSEYKQGNLSKEEKELSLNYLKNLRKYIDVTILMIVKPEVTIKRHKEKGETGQSDDYVLNNYISGLYEEYQLLKTKLEKHDNLFVIDGNDPIDLIEAKIKKIT